MTNDNFDPVQGLVDYVKDVKPFHTKIAEVIVEYLHRDALNVTMKEQFDLWLHQDQPHSYFRAKVKSVGIPATGYTYSFINKTSKVFYIAGNFADLTNPRVLKPGYVINVSSQGQLTQQYTITNVQYDAFNQYTITSVREPITFTASTGTITVNGNAFVMTKAVFDTLQTAQWQGNINPDYQLIDCDNCSPCYNSLTAAVREDAIVYEQYTQSNLPCYTILKPKKKKGKQKRTTKTKFVEYYGGNYTRAFSPGRRFRVKQSHNGLNDRVYTVQSSFFDIANQETYVYVEETIVTSVPPLGEADVFMFDAYHKNIRYRAGYGYNFDGPHPDQTVYEIIGVDGRANTITVSGDHIEDFFTGELITARHSAVNGTHTVLNAVLDGNGNTTIYTYNNIRGIPSGPTLPLTSPSGAIYQLTAVDGAFQPGFYRGNGTGWQTYHGGELVHTKYVGYDGNTIGHFESMPDLWLQVYFTEQLDITTTGLDFTDTVHLADMENPYRGFQYGYDVDPFGSYQTNVPTTIQIAVIASDGATNAYIIQGKRDALFVKGTIFQLTNPLGAIVEAPTVKGSLYNESSNSTHVFINGIVIGGDLTGYTVPYTYKSTLSFPQHTGYSSFGEDIYHLSDSLEVDAVHNALKVKGGNFLRRFVPTVDVTMVDNVGTSFSTGHTRYVPLASKNINSFSIQGDYSWLFKASDYVYLDYFPAPVRQTITVRDAVYSAADQTTQLVVAGDRTVDTFRAAGRMIFDWTTQWIITTSAGVYNSTDDTTYVMVKDDQTGVFLPFVNTPITMDFITFPDTTDGVVRLSADSVYDNGTDTTLLTTTETLSASDGYILLGVYRHESPNPYTYLQFTNTVPANTAAIYYKIPPALRIDTEVEILDQASTSLFTNLYDQYATIYRRVDQPGGTLVPPPSSGNNFVFEFQQGNILQRFTPGYPFYGKNVAEVVSGPYRTAFLPVSSVGNNTISVVGPVDFSFLFVPGSQIYVDYTGSELLDFQWFTVVDAVGTPIPGAWQTTITTVETVPHPVEEIPLSVLSGVQLIENEIVKTKVWVKNTSVPSDIIVVYHENWTGKNLENLVFSDEIAMPSEGAGLTKTQMATTFIEHVSFKNVVNQWYQYYLLVANHTNNTFVVAGNAAVDIIAGSMFEVVGTGWVDGKYSAASVVYSSITGQTTIAVTTQIRPGWTGPSFKQGWVEPADTRFKWNVVASNTGSADLVLDGDATQDMFTGRDFMLVMANGNQFDNIRVQSTPVYDSNTHTTSLLTLPPITFDASGGYVRHTAQEESIYEAYHLVFRDYIRAGFTEDTTANSIGYSGEPSYDAVNGFARGMFDITPFDQNIQQSLHLYSGTYRF